MSVKWRGVFPAATTQFKADQSLDVAATLRHLDVMLDAGVEGLIMLGTVGENCSLEYPKKLEVVGRALPADPPGETSRPRSGGHCPPYMK